MELIILQIQELRIDSGRDLTWSNCVDAGSAKRLDCIQTAGRDGDVAVSASSLKFPIADAKTGF
jgi:hypothetical protein